ncbi:MAG: amidohydrolase [Acidimicrobiia bacterium]
MAADLVFRNGSVFRADAARSWARSVGVAGARISSVGGSEVDRSIGPNTRVIDLDGRVLLPGFQDAHVHPATAGRNMLGCDLSGTAVRGDAEALISRYAVENPDRSWVTGGGWRFDWFERGMPTRDLLDALVPDRPAYLRVADGHAGWANTRAFAAAGIDLTTPDPAFGRIERLPDGTPQGTLQEGAMDLIERALPPETDEDIERALLAAQEHLISLGITAWQDAAVGRRLHESYARLAADGRLRVSVRGAHWWEPDDGMDQLEDFEDRRRGSVDRYDAGSVKLMLDGVCENFTARMLLPYLDDQGRSTTNTGSDHIDPAALPDIVEAVMRRGFQPHFHALGDAAVRGALDAVAAANARIGHPTDLRPHLAHIQVVDPDDIPRFREVGAVANAQALWACHDDAMDVMTMPFLDPQCRGHQYPFRSILDAGGMLAMGSDWSVTTPDVMQQVDAAVNRKVIGDDSRPPFLPDERISVADALAAFTAGSAFVNHLDGDRGTIRPGAIADLAVLDGNPFTSADIASIGVGMTVIGGEVVYEA